MQCPTLLKMLKIGSELDYGLEDSKEGLYAWKLSKGCPELLKKLEQQASRLSEREQELLAENGDEIEGLVKKYKLQTLQEFVSDVEKEE